MLDSDYQQYVLPHLRAAMQRLRDPQAVWDILRSDDTVAEMERLTARQRPAVIAASTKLLGLGDWVRGKDARTTFGKITRCVMEMRGYVVASRGVETPDDPLFTKATRYRLREPAISDKRRVVLNIGGVDAELLSRLRRRSTLHGRSIEAEALDILTDALLDDRRNAKPNLAEAIHRRFAPLGGVDDLIRHPPVSAEPPPEFDP
ncbi:MAG TPA: hypothetical protein VFX06_00765 [Stellaceae bacterium]|nr:hypothetical protein [Stellaceae bacterium]